MKAKTVFRFLAVMACVAAFAACQKEQTITYDANVPVYMSFDEFRASFRSAPAREIKQAGKIYLKDHFIFINEVNEGIHVINNIDPTNPRKEIFYEIPGNVDIAIRGNILFADSYIDLVAIDISDLRHPVEVGRLENAFPLVTAWPEDAQYPVAMVDYSQGVIVGWQVREVTETLSRWNHRLWWGPNYFAAGGDMAGGGAPQAGIAGSMARFMLHQHYLYAVTNPYKLQTLDVSEVSAMTPVHEINTWREMETLFRLDGYLFVGTTSGMVIYDLADPAAPHFVSDFDHANACDPVVVENHIAYVTLRSGNACNNFTNQLDVIDVSDIQKPRLLKSYPLFNPHGLGIDQGILFICDGADGLKVYDAANPLAIQSNMIAHFPGIDTYDVIPYNGVLILIGHDGLFQYDYSDIQNISLLSHIVVAGSGHSK
jgi:hypothetical protein